MSKAKITDGFCSICPNEAMRKRRREGVEIKVFWFIKVFICQSCLSRLFRQFRREVE